ncbi:MAG: hypothetical protein J5833_05730, partial [Victivallales bacterium]|nr:hypothetical protein [Victivallales bacterium]
MNGNAALPETLVGCWIWQGKEENSARKECDYLLYRQEFSIFEMPGVAELWIASHHHFQVFVNGRMATYGPIPHPGYNRGVYAIGVDITHLVEVGLNSIAVAVLKENTPLAGVKQTVDGFWMQLNLDDAPVAATDGNWLCLRCHDYFRATGLRAAPGDVFVEHADMRALPADWRTAPISDLLAEAEGDNQPSMDDDSSPQWTSPQFVADINSGHVQIESFGRESGAFDYVPPSNIICGGTFSQGRECTNISFAGAIAKRHEFGLYVAEAYVYSPPEQKLVGICVCDEPYVMFLNETKVKSQAVPPLPLRSPTQQQNRHLLAPHEMVDQSFEMKLKSGWNRIVFAQQCSSENSGALFIWPDLPVSSIRPMVKPMVNSQEGWMTAGPLNVPMALLYPSFPFDELVKVPYSSILSDVNDIAAFYLACVFKPEDNKFEGQLPVTLRNGEYVIFDFEKTFYSLPRLLIDGNDGDILDIICGELCQNGEVIAYELGIRRNAITLTLRGGSNEWLCSTRKGTRYLMVIARNIHDHVSIRNIDLGHEMPEYKNSGSFQSSSPTLDNVWNIGVRTLETTMRRIYIDSPTKGQAQSIPDAMIQSLASYYVFGEYARAGHAIENFARSQFETGEMNALSPSGLFQAVPDYSLCWPVWLYKHYQHTGDHDLLQRMMPTLKNLLFYYNEMATEPDGPLGDLSDYLGVHPFVDFGDIDRRGISTALNAFYCRALRSAAWLAGQVGEQELEDAYNKRATAVATKVNSLTWNEAKGLFADCWYKGRQSSKFSWQSSLLAIYGGIAKPHYYDEIWDRLFTDEAPLERFASGEFNNPYFKYFVLETAFALGKSPWALSLIHYYWGRMAKAGATTWWEMFDPQSEGQDTRICGKCHGYGVSPNSFIISELVGIRPAEPGMHRVYFNPMPGDVIWLKASIPTPHGHIMVHWKLQDDENFTVTINSNYLLEVIPVLAPGIAKGVDFK